VHPNQVDLAHLAALRTVVDAPPADAATPRGGLLSIEPFTTADRQLVRPQQRACAASSAWVVA
jgi:hypothetical protein